MFVLSVMVIHVAAFIIPSVPIAKIFLTTLLWIGDIISVITVLTDVVIADAVEQSPLRLLLLLFHLPLLLLNLPKRIAAVVAIVAALPVTIFVTAIVVAFTARVDQRLVANAGIFIAAAVGFAVALIVRRVITVSVTVVNLPFVVNFRTTIVCVNRR